MTSGPKGEKHAILKVKPAKSPVVNFAKIEPILTAPSPAFMGKKNFEQKLLTYLWAWLNLTWVPPHQISATVKPIDPKFFVRNWDLVGTN